MEDTAVAALRYPVLFDAFAPERPGASSAVDVVLAAFRAEDPWDYDPDHHRELQLAAFNERLAARREQIPTLAQRAEQLDVDEVASFDEVLPMVFSPGVYKSYPGSFLTKGKWSSLLRWLDSLCTARLSELVSVDDVTDIDGFIDRLGAAGYPTVTTSGTSGKVSILPGTPLEDQRAGELAARTAGTQWNIDPAGPHPLFYASHRSGAHRGTQYAASIMRAFGVPEQTFALFEERMQVGEISQLAALNERLASGLASPSELVQIRANEAAAAARSQAAFDRFIDHYLEYTDRPLYIWGLTFAHYSVMRRAKERGVKLSFAPGSAMTSGGGLKGNRVAPGWQEELREFYNLPLTTGYGQSEVIGTYLECSAGRWHLPPTTMLLLTDASGERLIGPLRGIVEGVPALFDFSADGHWGGVAGGDWLTVDFDRCGCGRRGPSVLDCRRVAATGGDDKLNCQGRVEMYIRGVLDEPTAQ
jgi:hypothetical protein